jgi:hypothetical protein
MEAQFAPVNAIVAADIDNDGLTDLVLAGNEYQADVITGRYDASYGCFLKGGAKGFTVIPPLQSGFITEGDVKSMLLVPAANKERLLAVGINNEAVKVFRLKP